MKTSGRADDTVGISERNQILMVWWAAAFFVTYVLALFGLMHMVPPPSPGMSTAQIAAWYAEHHTSISIGAMVTTWTAGFNIPLTVVAALQMARLERGRAWSLMYAISGGLVTIFLALPPIAWGAANYLTDRDPEITAALHHLGMLTFWTTDQYVAFPWIAIAAVCLQSKYDSLSPFPRWFGYYSIWSMIIFEPGAIAFGPHSGPFAWNGVFVFWLPGAGYLAWMTTLAVLLLRALKRQLADTASGVPLSAPTHPSVAA